MPNWLDKLTGNDKDNKKPAGNNSNPFGGFKLPGQTTAAFKGQGQSLGGTLPGKVFPVELHQPGPLGMRIEKRPQTGTCIVAEVIANTQAQHAGVQRGDFLCFAGSNGTQEIPHSLFLDLAKSPERPLCFEIRRIQTTTTVAEPPTTTTASADAYTRKQAMIAAAEAREKEHKKKTKPVAKKTGDFLPPLLSTAEKRQLEEERLQNTTAAAEPKSEASRLAAQAAKQKEAKTAAQLGYNPYETNKVTSGQARNATVTMQQAGAIILGDDDEQQQLPAVAAPPDLTQHAAAAAPPKSTTTEPPPSPAFQQAFETLVTANCYSVTAASLPIVRKLVTNATTKTDDKFKKVRLQNPKIQAALVEPQGALDIMLACGFELTELDGESVLMYASSSSCGPPSWLPAALQQMEQYEKSNATGTSSVIA